MIASRMVQLFSVSRFSTTIAECKQRGADQPRHERGVLDRVPEPPAAPAQRVVGPPASHRDADGERAPGGQRPRPHPARPGGIDAALDQRRDREGERHREADIAEIEKRRMEGEAGILQHRIEAVAVRAAAARRAGTGSEVNRMNSRNPTPIIPCTASTRARSAGRQVVAEQRHRGAEQREDEHPQQHRAFVVAPHAGDLVEQRLVDVAVLGDVQHREIRRDIGVHQRREGERDQRELRQRGACAERHQPGVTRARAPQRHGRLHQRQRQRQDQREMAELDDHGFALAALGLLLPVAGASSARRPLRAACNSRHAWPAPIDATNCRCARARPRPRRPVLRGTDRATRRCRSPST